jgi:hypothetical protein
MAVYTFPAALYADAVPFAGVEESRYYLRGVFLGPHIVATDGNALIAIDPGSAGPGPGVILQTNKALLAAAKPQKSDYTDTRWLTIDTAADTARVSVAETAADAVGAPAVCQIGKALIDGTFPRYLCVLPQPQPGVWHPVHALNPRYLAPFLKMRDASSVCLTASAEPGAPLMVRFGGRDDVLGVLMPMRSTPDYAEMPGWICRA